MERIRRITYALNDYFFDVDPNEAPDYVSATIFYGAIVVILIAGVILAVATIFGM